MNKIIDYFIGKSLLVNLVTVMIVIAGTLSIISLQKEVFPKVEFDFIFVRANYPGASAEDVELLVTIPLEREIKEVNGIEELNAVSGEGYAILTIKVDPDYELADVHTDIRDAISKVSDLPSDVDPPVVTIAANNRRLLRVALNSSQGENYLRSHGKRLRDKLEQLPEIARVSLEGYRPEIMEIAVDPKALNFHELTLAEIVAVLRDRHINISAGNIKSESGELLVRTYNQYQTVEDIEKVVVRTSFTGGIVTVGDVAKVKNTLKDRDQLYRSMGEAAIYLTIQSKESADVIDTSDKIKSLVANYFNDPALKEIKYEILDDLSFFVKRRLSILTTNGLQGLALVLVCLMLFLNLRVSLITAIGAPLAFMVAFMLMDYFGLSINLISMFALIMVLGMLVDDSIIVSENFYQYLEKGYSPKEAASIAAKETVAPVTATILTTIVAFGSLLFMGGIMGKFIWPIPIVIIICLIASWLECFLILPSHLADFVKRPKGHIEQKPWFVSLINFYEKSLRFALRRSLMTCGLFLIAFVGSLLILKFSIKTELFPGDDVTTVMINIKGKVGTPLDHTNEALKKVESKILNVLNTDEELMSMRTSVGESWNQKGTRTGTHYGQVTLYLTYTNERERSTDDIIQEVNRALEAQLDGYVVNIDTIKGGPPQGEPVNVEIYGDDLDELINVAKEAHSTISKVPGILTSELDYEEGKQYIVVDVDEQKARRVRLTNLQIALEVRRIYEGEVATEIRKTDEDIDVLVRMDEISRTQLETLKEAHILNAQNQRIALKNVASFTEVPGSFVIRRKDRKRVISILGQINTAKGFTTLGVNKEIGKEMDQFIKKYPELNYQLAGENKDTQESLQRLAKAGVISFFCIFIILVAMFGRFGQPLIIMSAIPLGLIGVILIFFVLSKPFSFMAFLGMIGLVGVVVNDSIVLVNFINQKIQEGGDKFEAIVSATLSRFRPVLLTTFTTVAGLLPIAHMPGGDPFLKPMALSFAYGLIFSTSLTLVFVPCSYLLYEKFIALLSSFIAQKQTR